MNHPLFIVGIMFFLSLLGAYVLFKILKSTAFIQKDGYRVGGAAAGFVVIYSLLYYSYIQLSAPPPHIPWTVTGCVMKEGVTNQKGTVIRQMPPSFAMTNESGFFRLENIRTKKDAYPELQFENPGYYPFSSYKITGENARIDSREHRIELSDTVMLSQLPQ